MEIFPVDVPRSASVVARRALALFGAVAVAFGADREQITGWLHDNELWRELTPAEVEFMESASPSEKQTINASWYSERLVVLVWALRLTEMPDADQQCDTSIFVDQLPPYAEVKAAEFINAATLRPQAELLEQRGAILDLHWIARDASIRNREDPPGVDLGIIQERHHAINWLVGYEGLDWDEVTTDT